MRRSSYLALVVLCLSGCGRDATPPAASRPEPSPATSVLADSAIDASLPLAHVDSIAPPPLTTLRIAPPGDEGRVPPPDAAPDEPPPPSGAVDRLPVDDRLHPPVLRTSARLALGAHASGWVELDVRVDEAGDVTAARWAAGRADTALVRPYDGGEAMLDDWVRVYNDSFAQHYRFMPTDHERGRRLAADPTFRADGLLLAYRDGHCAGFCRNELHASRGEVGTLGVAQAARGIGLGRALLRWGVRWLETHQPHAVTLLVDGENENALGLYQSEGFEIARTREIWRLPAGTRG